MLQWTLRYKYLSELQFFSEFMPRNGIAGSYSSSNFCILMNLHTVLHNCWNNLYFHGQYKRVPFPLHLSSIYCLYIFLMMGILTRVRWYFNVVLICNFLIISNAEHFFMCFLTICMSFLEKSLFSSSTHFFIFIFLYWVVCIFWRLAPCLLLHLQIFSPILIFLLVCSFVCCTLFLCMVLGEYSDCIPLESRCSYLVSPAPLSEDTVFSPLYILAFFGID